MGDKSTDKSVDKYKYTLLAVVGLVVLVGSFVLFYQIQKQQDNPGVSSNEDLTRQITDLNSKIDSLNKQIEEAKNQSPTVETKSYSTSSSSGSVAGASSQRSGMININSASVSQLDSLSGIGPTYAQRIIDYRNANGGFKSIEEIKNVKGIGDKTFDKFKDSITI